MEIVLVRHGEPEWVRNELNVVDPPLTERGHMQAACTGDALTGHTFDEVIVTLFAAGAGTKTIPVWIFNSMQRPNELPVVNVVALVLVLLSILPVWLAQRISGGEASRGGRY